MLAPNHGQRNGFASGDGKGPIPWELLDEGTREANRARIREIPTHLDHVQHHARRVVATTAPPTNTLHKSELPA